MYTLLSQITLNTLKLCVINVKKLHLKNLTRETGNHLHLKESHQGVGDPKKKKKKTELTYLTNKRFLSNNYTERAI